MSDNIVDVLTQMLRRQYTNLRKAIKPQRVPLHERGINIDELALLKVEVPCFSLFQMDRQA